MEVLHGDIRITLSDADAIRGLERTRVAVKRGLGQISREKAEVSITGDIKGLERSIKRAEAELDKFAAKREALDAKRATLSGGRKGALTKEINALDRQTDAIKEALDADRARIPVLKEHLDVQRQANKQAAIGSKEAKLREGLENDITKAIEKQAKAVADREYATKKMYHTAYKMNDQYDAKIQESYQKEGQLRVRARNDMESDHRRRLRLQQEALDMETARPAQVAKLRQEYNKASAALQRMNQQGLGKRLGRAASPDAAAEFDINQSRVIGEMEILRSKLAALGAKPIDIHVNVKQSRVMEKLFGIGDIGTRLGPFSGTLKQFSVAALALGPILVGLLGSVTALTGAVGSGLAGGLGVAGAAATGFGLSLGGVGFLLPSLLRDFGNLNTLQDAYHKQVLKTGEGSDKAKTKLQEFKHALGEVTPTTLAAFLSLNKLQDRWRGLRKDVRPDFLKAVGETFTTLNTDFGVFSRGTKKAFREVADGWNGWMKGLRSGEAQNIIFTLMSNANKSLKPFMEGLGHLGAAWGRVAMSFSRYFPAIFTGFDNWTEKLDHASQNVDKVDGSVDRLMGSLKSTGGVLYAFGRVVKEIASASMGPGGGMLDNMAGGLNDIADAIHRDPNALSDFFGESIDTVQALYGVLQPLAALFIEFSTIMRPATTAILSVLGPIADFTKWLASLTGVHAALQAWGTLWLFKKGTALIVGTLAGSVNALALAFERLGKAKLATALGGGAVGRPATVLGGGVPAARTATSAAAAERNVARAATSTSKVPTVVSTGGAARTVATGAGVAKEAATVGKLAKFGGALSVASTALLGVSAPVAGLGLAAVGAGIGIKHLMDNANKRAAQEAHVRDTFGQDAISKRPTPTPTGGGRGGQAGFGLAAIRGGATPGQSVAEWEKERTAVIAATKAYEQANAEIAQSGIEQRNLVSVGSQLQNSHLMVESAEKAYADAVKNSGKKSLEARMALQQLRDARTADQQAQKTWADTSLRAMNAMERGVKAAKAAYEAAKGTRLEDDMAARLDRAKNSAAALDINLRRAKKGMDVFTGSGAEKIGAFMREYGKIPGVKRIMVQVESQQAAEKLASVIGALEDVGKKKAVAHILATADSPKQALKELNHSLDLWEKRHSVSHLEAKKEQAEKVLNDANLALSHYGRRKPKAVLDARDDAQKKIDRLNKQLDHLDGKKSHVEVSLKFKMPDANDFGGPGRGAGDGWGVPNVKESVKKFTMAQGGKLSSMMLGAGGLGGFPASGSGLNAFNGVAQRFGLTVGSGSRPGAITESGNLSYHAMGRARDFPGSPGQMMKFAKFMSRVYGRSLKELIYTPLGYSIKNGAKVPPYAQKDHYDHVHVAMAQGGERPRSGKYTQPTVLFAEEPNRPEYFISTNPRDRKRSRGLIAQAAADVGMLEHGPLFNAMGTQKMAKGGAFGKLTPRAKKIWDFFLSAGFTKQQAAGFIGNFMQESNLNPGAKQKGGPGRGLAQWGGDRFNALQNFAKKRHTGWDDLGTQLAFVVHELAGKESKAGKSIRSSKSVKAAVKAIQNEYERAGIAGNRYGPAYTAFHSLDNVKSGGGSSTPSETPTLGPSFNLNTRLASAQGRLDVAATTATNYQDDINAIYGYNTPAQRRRARGRGPQPNMNQGEGNINGRSRGRTKAVAFSSAKRGTVMGTVGGTTGGLGKLGGRKEVHHEGILDVMNDQDTGSRKRLKVINGKLKGRLTKEQRSNLLSEKADIKTSLSGNKVKKKELRTQGAEARFEKSQGANAKIYNDYRTAAAGSTASLSDDIAAAQAEATYYKNREAFLSKRGDIAGAAEARSAFNNATTQVKDLQHQTEESYLNYYNNAVESTETLDDDLALAKAEQTYWKGREAAALAVGDLTGAAEARGNYNAATAKVKDITTQIREAANKIKENSLSLRDQMAGFTGSLVDDLSVANDSLKYWQDRLKDATLRGDKDDIFTAQTNVNQYTETAKNLKEDMKRLPLERDAALADLTEDTKDDTDAAIALRDYWKGRLEQAKQEDDIQGQIEAAGNISTLNGQIKDAQENIATQMVLLSEARRDLYKNFGSNFIPTMIQGAQAYMPSQVYPTNAGGTTVNLTVNGATLATDPHTWSQGVAWEIQAAV